MIEIQPDKIREKISNKKTGEKYKNDKEWKDKGISPEDIRRDVTVIMPSLDLFGETKQNRTMAITNAQQFKQLVNPPMKGMRRPGYRVPGGYDCSDPCTGEGGASKGSSNG